MPRATEQEQFAASFQAAQGNHLRAAWLEHGRPLMRAWPWPLALALGLQALDVLLHAIELWR